MHVDLNTKIINIKTYSLILQCRPMWKSIKIETIFELLFIIPFFLCWGSFLNMLAYRLMNINTILEKRSFCPKCKKIIFWYDNIPVISWIILQAKCRHCKQKISALYPFIEIFTATIFSILYYQLKNTNNLTFLPAYFTFFSALIITFRTDLDFFVITI